MGDLTGSREPSRKRLGATRFDPDRKRAENRALSALIDRLFKPPSDPA